MRNTMSGQPSLRAQPMEINENSPSSSDTLPNGMVLEKAPTISGRSPRSSKYAHTAEVMAPITQPHCTFCNCAGRNCSRPNNTKPNSHSRP